MDIYGTDCCALSHLSGVDDDDSAEEIFAHIKRDLQGIDEGPKCLFAVTCPLEKILAKTLASIGFNKCFLFPRRNGNPGMLTLWVALVSDIKLKPNAVKRKAAKRKPRKTR